jgi:hypothetical protein
MTRPRRCLDLAVSDQALAPGAEPEIEYAVMRPDGDLRIAVDPGDRCTLVHAVPRGAWAPTSRRVA